MKLSPYRLHIPKLYGQIPRENLTSSETPELETTDHSDIWLLEYENFSSTVQKQLAKGEFLPTVDRAWSSTSGNRQ
ncbi:hypothetical protein SB781_34000, partial [Paraburkholderia sp. SIMBA_061]